MNSNIQQEKCLFLLHKYEHEISTRSFVLLSKQFVSKRKTELLIKHDFITNDFQDFSEDFKALVFKCNIAPGFVFSSFPNYTSGYKAPLTTNNCFFDNFLSAVDFFKEQIPKYDDRSSAFRKEFPEISTETFLSVLAIVILNSDITYNVIAIEQNSPLQALTIKYYQSFSQTNLGIRAVKLLTILNIIPYKYYSINAKNKESGILLKTSINQRIIELQLNYHTKDSNDIIGPLKDSELEVLDLFKDNDYLYQREILSRTNLSKRMINYSINSLIAKNLLKRHGEKGRKNTYYSKV